MDPKKSLAFSLTNLPVDIVYYILQTAALLDRGTAQRFALVSKTVRPWIEQILYSNVVLMTCEPRAVFVACIERRLAEDDGFFTRTVKSMCLTVHYDSYDALSTWQEVDLILNSCKGLTKLALWLFPGDNASSVYSADLRTHESLNYLSITDQVQSQIDKLPPTVTHLNIEYFDSDHDRILVPSICQSTMDQCPALTHLILDLSMYSRGVKLADSLRRIMGSPQLKLVLLEIDIANLPLLDRDELYRDLMDFMPAVQSTDWDTRFVLLCNEPYFATRFRGSNEYDRFDYPMNDWGYVTPNELRVWEYADDLRDRQYAAQEGKSS